MRECCIEDIKRISVEILTEFDRVCEENGLMYSIAYGTLLGAVRHNGFIPWDDDIDVIMPRKDYEKFIHVRSQLNEKYVFVSTDVDDKYTAPLAKIYDSSTLLREISHNDHFDLGVYIDIFVYDYVPQSEIARSILFKLARACTRIWGFATYSPKTTLLIEKIGRSWALKHNWGRKASIFKNNFAKKQTESDKMSNFLYSVYGCQKDTFPTDKLLNTSPISFEGVNVQAFSDREYFLKQWYGDYMKLPPEEKRVTHHNFIATFKED